MPNTNLILRTLISPWITPTPDTTKSSVLKHIDVDNNFIYLRGEIIYSATTVGNLVTLKKINGNDLSFNVGSGGGSDYWTSGSTGFYSIKTINDSGLDARGNYSVAQGFNTLASGNSSHAEGDRTDATGNASHAEGLFSNASGDYAHAEGNNTDATGIASHAEGQLSLASGNYSHAEGVQTDATNTGSHSEGTYSLASGIASHSEGRYTIASGNFSHAGGYGYDSNDRVVASGETSFAHQYVSNNNGDLGAYGNNSTILGGINNNIDSASTSSSILGGNNNRIVGATDTTILGGSGITGTTDNTVYVPNLEVRGQAYTPIYDNLTGGTTFIPDWDNSNVQILTLSGNTNISGGTSTMKGGSTYTMLVKQSNGGSHTITWDSTYKWEQGNPPTLSTADGSIDIITFICDGTSLYGLIAKDFQ